MRVAAPSSVAELIAQALRVIHIDPTAAAGGDGSIDAPFNSWSSFTLQAGDAVLQRGGTVSGGFAVTVHASADQPIFIGSYGTGRATVEGTVALSGAANVVIDDLDITGGNGAGVLFVNGTTDCTLRNSDIHGGMAGVVVTGRGMLSNTIADSRIYENDYAGIWFDEAIAEAGRELRVTGNTIYRNGQQGILLHGSFVVVDDNTVVNNGLSGLPGLSAIHVYATSADDLAGRNNTISNNAVAWQRDGSSPDGNGIMLDHWSSGQTVTGNHVFGNDGAGISILSSRDNVIEGNTVEGNMLDSGGTHVAARAEIFLGDSDLAPGLTTGNRVADNTVAAASRYGAAVQVAAPVSADPSNAITGNFLVQSGRGTLWIWGGESGRTIEGWNAVGHNGTDNAAGIPSAAMPVLDEALLDRSFTLHSDLLRTGGTAARSMLVAYGETKDLFGSPLGSWMAGDGRDNVLTAVGGNNLIAAGAGNATLIGGPGDDILLGGAGSNLMIAGSGNTMMIGGSGASRMIGGSGNDVIFAGNGTATKVLAGGGGENILVGGDGADTFVVGEGLASIIISFTPGHDLIDVASFGAADFYGIRVYGDSSGGAIADGAGVIRAFLNGGDVLALSAADFIFSAPAATATISLADTPVSAMEGNGGRVSFSFAVTRTGDLSRADSARWTVVGAGAAPADAADFDGGALPGGMVNFVAGEAIRTITVDVATDTDAEPDEGFTVALSAPYSGLEIGTATASATIVDDDGTVNCFATGTLVATPFGTRPVETLRAGDPVLTADGAARRLTWTGAWDALAADPAHRAVRVRAGAFGSGQPSRDLVVSPLHALWLEGVMVPAICLVDGRRVVREAAVARRYHHIATETHQVVLAEGLGAETFCPIGRPAHPPEFPHVRDPLPRLEQGDALRRLRARLGLAEPDPVRGPLLGLVERVLPDGDGIIVEGWATEGPEAAELCVRAHGLAFGFPANEWRVDLDRAGLPAAGFRVRLAVPPGTPVHVVSRRCGAALMAA